MSGHLVDPEGLIPELRSEFDATCGGSVGQLAYSYLRCRLVISCFSLSCGTFLSADEIHVEGLEALMLTFDTSEGSPCIINTSMPSLPSTTRANMLKEYVDAATDTEAESILIGRVVRAPPIFMDN